MGRIGITGAGRVLAVLAIALGAACAPAEETVPAASVEEAQQPIVGGTRSSTCQWATAVGMGNCTGTLVHPRIITTAAHCVTEGGPSEITFGESWRQGSIVRKVPVEKCVGAEGSGVEGDFGYCVLAEAVTDVPIVPILYGCETDVLQPGGSAVLAGFGRRGGISLSSGIKHHVDVPIGQIVGNDIFVGTSRRGGCQGDSGGPAYVRLADGTWRVFGATSRGSLFCTSQTIYTLIHPFVPWMESTSGFDVTPCHDADGTWNPGEGCGGFPVNPDAVGSWDNMCNHVERGGKSATCGMPAAE